jgi:hypothetical protein
MVWWQDATLFVYFIFYNIGTYIHSFNHIHTLHLSVMIRRGLSPFPHCMEAQLEKPPCGAEPRIELGYALQQADANQHKLLMVTKKLPLIHNMANRDTCHMDREKSSGQAP